MVKQAGYRHSGHAAPCGGQACLPHLERSDCEQASPKAGHCAGHCGGQATLEYVVVAGVLIALVAIMSLLMTTFGEYGERVMELIASDYP